MTIEASSFNARVHFHPEPKLTVSPSSKDGVTAWKKALAEEKKLHWQKVFQVGEFSPYDKNKKPVEWGAFREALYEAINDPFSFVQNTGTHIRKIDTEFRGGKDIGGAKERMERVAALSGVIVLFTAFDYATSKPFEKLFPLIPDRAKDGQYIKLSADDLRFNGKVGALKKIVEVMNDKYATALGNMLVEKLSGKRGFIHEVADKGADTLQVGYDNLNDLVNGATLESYMRIFSQLPIAGALFEQIVTRISMWQEKSSIHTATGKMLYMGLGIFIKNNRKADALDGASLAGILARAIT